jgi:hypothetical protein
MRQQAGGIEIVAHVTSLVYANASCLLACFFFCFSVRASPIGDSIVRVRVHYYAKRMRTCAHVRHDKTQRPRLVMDRVPV